MRSISVLGFVVSVDGFALACKAVADGISKGYWSTGRRPGDVDFWTWETVAGDVFRVSGLTFPSKDTERETARFAANAVRGVVPNAPGYWAKNVRPDAVTCERIAALIIGAGTLYLAQSTGKAVGVSIPDAAPAPKSK